MRVLLFFVAIFLINIQVTFGDDNLDTLKIQLEQDKATIKAILKSDNLDKA